MKTTAKDVLRRWLYPEPWCRKQQVSRALAETIYRSIQSHQRSDRCGFDQPAMDAIVQMGPAAVETVLHEINDERQETKDD